MSTTHLPADTALQFSSYTGAMSVAENLADALATPRRHALTYVVQVETCRFSYVVTAKQYKVLRKVSRRGAEDCTWTAGEVESFEENVGATFEQYGAEVAFDHLVDLVRRCRSMTQAEQDAPVERAA